MSMRNTTHLRVHETEVHEVFRVEPAAVPTGTSSGSWPCAACGQAYPVRSGWLLDYYHEPTREVARAYICAACAAQVSR
jgi:hypothetical protein